MDAPKNTVGTQITGQERDDLPDQMPAAADAGQPAGEAARPSEVERPHANDADHLTPAAPVHRGRQGPYETSGSPDSNRP